MFVDNQSAIHISKTPDQHKRLKHVDLKYHFIRSKVSCGIVNLVYIPSKEQPADICTKGLSRVVFVKLCKELGLQ